MAKATRPAIPHFEIVNRNGKWEWAYMTSNRRALAACTRGYTRKVDAINAIGRLREHIQDAEILIAQIAGEVIDEDARETETAGVVPEPPPNGKPSDEQGEPTDEETDDDDWQDVGD